MNFHQKLVVYYILDYFGILFILNINSVLRVKNSEGLRYC